MCSRDPRSSLGEASEPGIFRAAPGVAAVLRNRDLRRVAVSYVCFISTYSVWIAMLVYAFDQGGATTAGLVALAQLIPMPVAASEAEK